MGSGASCYDSQGNEQEMVCPDTIGTRNGGEIQMGDRSWHTEQHSYVSIGILNLYLSTQITSGGLALGFFLGMMITLGVWFGMTKRKAKLKRKDKAKKEESSMELARVIATGQHSSKWPASLRGPGENANTVASAPGPPPSHHQQLVPLDWGRL